jgi:hypothetical protein
MDIPTVPRQHLVKSSIRGNIIPIMPFITVLLLKLQAWADHRLSRRPDLRAKQHMDVADINQLLRIAVTKEMHVLNESWLPESFVAAGKRRVLLFVSFNPHSAVKWGEIGLMDR